MFLDNFQSRCAGVACVGTQVLVSSQRWIGSLNNEGIQHGFKLRNIMSVCSGHDERQRDATTVHQQMAFAPIFFSIGGIGPNAFLWCCALLAQHADCQNTHHRFGAVTARDVLVQEPLDRIFVQTLNQQVLLCHPTREVGNTSDMTAPETPPGQCLCGLHDTRLGCYS